MPAAQLDDPPPRILDVRQMRKPDKHSAIFDLYHALAVGESFVLLDDHDPIHLREELETDHPGSYEWEYLSREAGAWHIKITKRASTPLPRVLVNIRELPEDTATAGAIWSIAPRERDLDSNIISLPPDDTIETHAGPSLDVLIHVLAGDGVLISELGEQPLSAGDLVFLPRQSHRGFRAGSSGLRYLTVHRKRAALVLTTSPPSTE